MKSQQILASDQDIEDLLDSYRDGWPYLDAEALEQCVAEHQFASDAVRRRALYRLVMLDIDLRRRQGESVDSRDYQSRFRELAEEEFSDVASLPPPKRKDEMEALLLPSRYRPIKKVGRGGLGVVWQVEDLNLGRHLAIKIPRPEVQFDVETNARLKHEASITGALQHPGIPPVVERGESVTGVAFFSMKLIDGQTLADQLADRETVDQERTQWLEVLLQVSESVAYAHAQNVIHCDLKPHNVMVGKFGEVQLMDWGMARRLESNTSNPSAVVDTEPSEVPRTPGIDTHAEASQWVETKAGQVMGSPAYMAPEQARGERHQTDTRTDVYALGAILYEILTGKPPASGKSSQETLQMARLGKPVPVREHNPKVPADLEVICMKALSFQPSDRYQSAGDFAEDLQRWLRGLPIQSQQHSARSRFGKWLRRHPTTAALLVVSAIALTGLIVLGVGAWFYYELGQAHQQLTLAKVNVDKARDSAVQAAAESERQKKVAEVAQALAEDEHQRADTAEFETRRIAYAADMNLADLALAQGELPMTNELLAKYENASDGEDLRGFEWYFLKQQSRPWHQRISLPSLTSLRHATYSPERQELFVATNDGGTRVLRISTVDGQLKETIPVEFGLLRVLYHSGRMALVGFREIEMRDLESGEVLWKHTCENPISPSFSPDGTRFTWRDFGPVLDQRDVKEVRVADSQRGEVRTVADTQSAEQVRFFSDQELVVALQDGTFFITNLDGERREKTLSLPHCQTIKVSQDQKWIAVSANGMIRAIDAERMEIVKSFLPKGELRSLAFGESYKPELLYSDSHMVYRVSLLVEEPAEEYIGCEHEVKNLGLINDGNHVFAASMDGTILIWRSFRNVESAQLNFDIDGFWQPISLSGNGERLLITKQVDKGMEFAVVGLKDQKMYGRRAFPEVDDQRGLDIRASHEGDHIWIEAFADRLLRWELSELDMQGEPEELDGRIIEIDTPVVTNNYRTLNLSDDGESLTLARAGRQVCLLNTESEQWTNYEVPRGLEIEHAVLTPNRRHLVGVGMRYRMTSPPVRENILCIWDYESKEMVFEEVVDLGSDRPEILGFTPEENVIIGGSSLEVWDVPSQLRVGRISRLKTFEKTVYSAVVSPDGRRLFLGCRDRTCEVWDLTTFRQVLAIRQPARRQSNFSALYMPNDSTLLSFGFEQARVYAGGPDGQQFDYFQPSN